ncbi:MAG: hypothetical protein COT17_05290 [Elusimicrobia bacterium CG08_land_8_20_14_0_20_51_18]|nr:MAG: hypothetical protein COT17_05290 [Elusimicrobia bacterium CG08_land_8_20_14_0_20_51_18]
MTKAAKEKEENINLDNVIADYGPSKYNDVVLAMLWATHLKFTEEYRLKPVAEIIDVALKDVVSKKVTEEEIKEAVGKDNQIKMERISEKKDARKDKLKKKEKTKDEK